MNDRMRRFVLVFSIAVLLTGGAVWAGDNGTWKALEITEVFLVFDEDPNIIFIFGKNIDMGDDPIVMIGDYPDPLVVIQYSENEIEAELPDDLAAGDYLLTIRTGNAPHQFDAYDLTVGSAGPQGPVGPQGEPGPPGSPGSNGLPCSVVANGDDTFTMICPDGSTVTWAGAQVEIDTDGDGVPDTQDCEPEDPGVFPGNIEVCDGRDNNCDTNIDEGIACTFCKTDVLFVIDTSASMAAKFDDVAQSVTELVQSWTFGDDALNAGLVLFATESTVAVPLTGVGADTLIADALSVATVGGSTCTWCALTDAYTEMTNNPRPGGQQIVILITDGVPSTGNTNHLQLGELVRSFYNYSGGLTYAIGDEATTQTFLELIADRGATSEPFVVQTFAELPQVFPLIDVYCEDPWPGECDGTLEDEDCAGLQFCEVANFRITNYCGVSGSLINVCDEIDPDCAGDCVINAECSALMSLNSQTPDPLLTACFNDCGCIDLDGDFHGEGCQLGPDCDDSDADIFPGNTETCDGKDNDCDLLVDEDIWVGACDTELPGVCSLGTIACHAGVFVCQQDMFPSAEVCDDGLDNDCDGLADLADSDCQLPATVLIEYCELQHPSAITLTGGEQFGVYGRVFSTGLTGLNAPHPSIVSAAGIGPDGSDPRSDPGWSWNVGGFFGSPLDSDMQDEYTALVVAPYHYGQYDFAFRFSGDSGATWTYCDLSGSSDGYSPADAGDLFVID